MGERYWVGRTATVCLFERARRERRAGGDTLDTLIAAAAHDIRSPLTAMKGFDFIFSTGSYTSDDMTDMAIEWSKNSGGLCAFTWHWNVPKDIDNPDSKKSCDAPAGGAKGLLADQVVGEVVLQEW